MEDFNINFEENEYLIMKGHSENKASFIDSNLSYILVGLIFLAPAFIICFSGFSIINKILSDYRTGEIEFLRKQSF